MSDKPHMTPEQVDQMISGLKTRTVSTFKVSHCLKLREGGVWCLDINQRFESEAEIGPALVKYCSDAGWGGAMAHPAPPEGWKRFIAAPRPIPPPKLVKIRGTRVGGVLIVLRTEAQ